MNKKVIGLSALILLAGVYIGAKFYSSKAAKEKLDELVVQTEGFAEVEYEDVSVNLFAMDVTIKDIAISNPNSDEKLNIGEVIIHEADDKSEIPEFLNISVNDIEVAIESFGEEAKQLKQMGYPDNIMLDIGIDYSYNQEKKEVNFKKLALSAQDMGEIKMNLRLGELSLDPEKMQALIFSFPIITFLGGEITFDDHSLTNKIIKHGAKKENVEEEEFRKELLEGLEKSISQQEDEFVKQALTSLKQFIKNPNKISISASPEQPQQFMSLMETRDPMDLIKKLNVTIN